jgi:hypothetical protein
MSNYIPSFGPPNERVYGLLGKIRTTDGGTTYIKKTGNMLNVGWENIIPPPPATYTLLVTGSATGVYGFGSGEYESASYVIISSSYSGAGTWIFDSWSGSTSHLLSGSTNPNGLSMPTESIYLYPIYVETVLYGLIITGSQTGVTGIGSGNYESGSHVQISSSYDGSFPWTFNSWSGSTEYLMSGSTTASNTISMPPSESLTLYPVYNELYQLTVVDSQTDVTTTGTGAYTSGSHVVISSTYSGGESIAFSNWSGDTDYLLTGSSITNPNGLIMSNANVTLTPVYIPAPTYALTVNAPVSPSGVTTTGTGNYSEGTLVNIDSNFAGQGSTWTFDHWSGNTGYLISDVATKVNSIIMPAAAVSLTSAYLEIFSLTLSGTPGGVTTTGTTTYTAGITKPISSSYNTAPDGWRFNQWTGVSASAVLASGVYVNDNIVNTPSYNLNLTASYSDYNLSFEQIVIEGATKCSETNGVVVGWNSAGSHTLNISMSWDSAATGPDPINIKTDGGTAVVLNSGETSYETTGVAFSSGLHTINAYRETSTAAVVNMKIDWDSGTKFDNASARGYTLLSSTWGLNLQANSANGDYKYNTRHLSTGVNVGGSTGTGTGTTNISMDIAPSGSAGLISYIEIVKPAVTFSSATLAADSC